MVHPQWKTYANALFGWSGRVEVPRSLRTFGSSDYLRRVIHRSIDLCRQTSTSGNKTLRYQATGKLLKRFSNWAYLSRPQPHSTRRILSPEIFFMLCSSLKFPAIKSVIFVSYERDAKGKPMELKQSARWTFAKPMMKKLVSPLWKSSQAGMPVWWLSFLHKRNCPKGQFWPK